MIRAIRPISLLRESLMGTAVLLFGVPILLGGGVFFVSGLIGVLDQEGLPSSRLHWVMIWAALSAAVTLVGGLIIYLRLRAGRSQPHYSEYRQFKLIRHARFGPLINPERVTVNGAEVVRFDLQYFVSGKHVPKWWPVLSMDDARDLKIYRHPVVLCPLASSLPGFQLWSRSHRWDTRHARRIIKGHPVPLHPDLDRHFESYGDREVESLFQNDAIRELLASHPAWSIEVTRDRLLAYAVSDSGNPGTDSANDDPVHFVARLGELLSKQVR